MKRTLFVLAGLACSATALAVPATLSHQGRLMDALGAPLTGSHDLTVSIYSSTSGGTPLWSEDLTANFDDGYYHVILGNATTLDTDTIPDTAFLGLTVDTGPEFPQRIELTSVPFALRADTSVNVDGGVVNASEIQVGGSTVIDSSGKIDYGATIINAPPASDTLLDLGCTTDEIARYNGSAWECADGNDHAHDAGAITSGQLAIARVPVGASSGTVAAGDHAHPGLSATCPNGEFLTGFDSSQNPVCRSVAGAQSGYSLTVTVDAEQYGKLVNQNVWIRLDLDAALSAAGVSGKTVDPNSVRVIDEATPPYREVPSRVLRTYASAGDVYLWFNTQNTIDSGSTHEFEVYFNDTDDGASSQPNYALSPPLDVAVSWHGGVFATYIGDYKGSIQTWVNDGQRVNPGGGDHNCVAVADFDNDGDHDYLMARQGDGNYYYAQNVGNGGFSTFLSYRTTGVTMGTEHCMASVAGDFNEDGNMDVVVARDVRAAGGMALLLGDGTGGFTQQSFPGPTNGCWYREMDVADFDNDGNLDVSQGTIYCDDWYIYWGDGGGNFTSRSTYTHAESNQDKYAMAAGDFDSDGDPDIMVGGAYDGRNDTARGLFDNTGGKNFVSQGYFDKTNEACNRYNVHGWAKAYDWDHDGWDDIIGFQHCDDVDAEEGTYLWMSSGAAYTWDDPVKLARPRNWMGHGQTSPRMGNHVNFSVSADSTADVL